MQPRKNSISNKRYYPVLYLLKRIAKENEDGIYAPAMRLTLQEPSSQE
jgi:hypothetical protein